MTAITRLGQFGVGLTNYGVFQPKTADVPAVPVQGVDPQIVMRVSFDGGRTYGNARMRSMGKIGAYKQQIVWNGLGTGSDCVIEVYGSDPVKLALTGALLDVEVLKSPSRGVAAKDGPLVSMRVSFDGGKTYGNVRNRSLGRIGEYNAAASWNGLGTGKDCVIEVYGSEPVKIALTGANFDAEVLNS